MKWIFQVQLFCEAQDQSGLDLLRFPGPPLLPPKARSRVSVWARGKATRTRSVGLDEFIANMQGELANEVQANFVFPSCQIPESQIVVLQIANQLSVSPTSSLWASTTAYEAPTPFDKRIQRTHRGKETGMKWLGMKNYPTLLESTVEIETNLPREILLPRLFNIIVQSFPQALIRGGVWGVADLARIASAVNLLDALAPWPKALGLLETRFDDFHSILIGSPDKCRGPVLALGPELSTSTVTCGPDSIEILYLPDNLVDAQREATRPAWLVPKDDSARVNYVPNEEAGEFKVGTGMIFTFRRQMELLQAGFVPTPSAHKDYYHLILPRYCEMLGWDPDDMVVMLWDKEAMRRADNDIDALFESLAHIGSLQERIWRAHKEVNIKYGWARYVIDFVEQRYFSVSDTIM